MESQSTEPTNSDISWFDVVSGLVGGVALSSFALKLMSGGLKQSLGPQLKSIIKTSTSNVLLAFLTGTVATAVMSSSTATSRLVVELVSVGAMTFEQSLGVSLGINVGSTVATQLVALKLTKWALLIAALGYGIQVSTGGKSAAWDGAGRSVFGLGLLFLGINIMGHAMDPLRSYPPFLNAITALQNPFLGVVAAGLLTALVQSSAVVIAIVMTLAERGVIPLPMAVSLVVGANVGTCSSAILSAVGGRRDTIRVALTYLMYKLSGACIFLIGIKPIAGLVARMTSTNGYKLVEAEDRALHAIDISTASELEAELQHVRSSVVPAVVANVHVFFNLAVGLMFLPFTTYISQLMLYLVPPEGAQVHSIRATQVNSGKESPIPTTEHIGSSGKGNCRRNGLSSSSKGASARRSSSRGRKSGLHA